MNAIFLPAQVSIAAQTVKTGYASGQMMIHYLYFQSNGTLVPSDLVVNLNTTAGSQPLVTEFTRSTNDVTVNALEASQWGAKLTAGAHVRVFGIPKSDGSLDAYVVNLFD